MQPFTVTQLPVAQPLVSPKYAPNGMRFPRRYTRDGVDPYTQFTYAKRSSVIRDSDGSVVFEMHDVEVPEQWSQVATDILAQKYFRKAGVPQYNDDGSVKRNPDGSAMLGSERTAKQVVHRLAGCWRHWGERYGYFASPADAQVFYDETVYSLLKQMVAPNSPQWFNTGLNWAYGVNGPAQGHYYPDPITGEVKLSEDSYTHPQPHACFIQSVEDDLVNPGGIMDLWVREARLFKYGSGTGTNFSGLRGAGEKLSGGGKSSGLMSWLKIGDRAAGAIKSGGTTRRAAKMVCLNVDHPDIEVFINWKVKEERKVAALIAAGYSSDYEGEAYQTVAGQNSNNSVRLTNEYLEAVEKDSDWHLRWRTDNRVSKTLKARDLWEQIAFAAWACADPGTQYDTTINEWHTCPQDGRINASNPCSEYMFLDNTACNLCSINLAHYFDPATKIFDVDGFRYTSRMWTTILEISVLMAQYPSYEIADMSFQFRTLGLGYANLGAGVLMVAGIPYDSEEARAVAGAITALMTGESYATSAEMAASLGAFSGYQKNREDMLRVMRNHRRAAYNVPAHEYEKLSIMPVGINPSYCPGYLLHAARESWDRAVEMGEKHGYRNAQTTLLAPTGTIGLLMDCATTGVEPDFALVKFKKLAGGGYFKIVNESLVPALQNLGYNPVQVDEIIRYMKGSGTLAGAPGMNHQVLKAKGFTDEDIAKVEKQLPGVFEIQFAFNVWTLGEETLKRLGFTEAQYNDFNFNMLRELGFTKEELAAANEFVCGTMTIEGAPHLRKEHYPVFDCANKCGKKGIRYIHHNGHIRMMAAVQPFLSGAISKTINMPNDATIEDIKEAYMLSWKLGLKANALYRDGCKLSQPLSTKSDKESRDDAKQGADDAKEAKKVAAAADEKAATVAAEAAAAPVATISEPVVEPMTPIAEIAAAMETFASAAQSLAPTTADGIIQQRRKLPVKRSGITIEAAVGNQQVYIRTGEYADGTLGEVFIDMFREGAAFRSLLNCFAVAVSYGLQYGVPLEKFVEKFTYTRFEPSGFTSHPNVKMCTSVIDYVFRVLAMEYLGRTDLVQVPPKGTQKNRAEAIKELIEEREEAKGFVPVAQGQEKLFTPAAAESAVSAQTMTTSATVELAKVVTEDAVASHGEPATAAPAAAQAPHGAPNALDSLLTEMMGDAPLCDTCGHITVRNGSCYRCLNCGASMGCS